jgi:molecular chaperone Hsp33
MTSRQGAFVVGLAFEGQARIMAVVADGPAEEVRTRHALAPAAALVAAEGLVASLLLSAHVKGEERLTVHAESAAPRFSFVADVNGNGTVRARFRPEELLADTRARRMRGTDDPVVLPGQRDMEARTFTGMLSVLKSLGPKELYRGVAEVQAERFEGALERYLTASQQVDGRVRIEAALSDDGRVVFAAGLLVERLPHMPREAFDDLVGAALADDFRELMTAFAFGQLAGSPVEVLGSQSIVFQCTCSRERVLGMLRSLGSEELRSMLAEQGRADVTCHFCNTAYAVDRPELEALAAAAAAAS